MLQVAEITGRLQHAEQTHTDLLTQIRSSPLQPPASSDTHAPASQASLAYTAAGEGAPQAALQGQSVNVNGVSKSSQRQDCSRIGEEEEPDRQGTDEDVGSQSPSASHDSSSIGTSSQSTQQQQQQQQDDSPSTPESQSRQSQPSAPASDRHMKIQLGRSSSALQKTLADLAESLAMDVTKLKGLLDCSESHEATSKVANWGFPKAEDSPGPSRPVTATPCDNMQRPNRQWSAGPTRHEAHHQHPGDAGQQRRSRPMTAAMHGRYAHDAAGMSLVDAAGRRSGVAPNRRSGQGRQADVWVDSVPPTRMPEEKLQQAREDYMKEKNRVREKRLQELAAKAGDGTDAS